MKPVTIRRLFFGVTLVLILICCGSIFSSPVEEKLEEIVELRKRELDLQQRLYSEQRISDVSNARIALARARIDLAKEKGEKKAVLEQLEAIVAIGSLISKPHRFAKRSVPALRLKQRWLC